MLAEKRSDFDLVTVKNRRYYVFRYEGKLNGIENAVVLLTYPEKAFGNSKALRAFISTDISLDTKEILDSYVERWSIEVFFRQCKNTVALDSYQIRSAKGIQRYWLLMSLAYFICSTSIENCISFTDGYHAIRAIIHKEKIQYIFQYAKSGGSLDELLKMVG